MRKTPLLLALSLALAAAPATLAAHHPAPGSDAPKNERTKGGPKGTHHLLKACVTADATADATAGATAAVVKLKVLSANRHMRDVLDGETMFTAKLDETTRIRLVGKARFSPEDGKLSKIGSWSNLEMDDVVTVRYRVKPGQDAASMPAWRVIDHGPFAKKCPVPATPPPVDEPPAGEL